MQLGVVFPQTEIGNDPTDIRRYAQAAETAGYSHLVAYDHVLGANPDRPGGLSGPYTYQSAFHEVFVLLAYIAAITKTLRLATGVLILPQRQTALVAKQAAALDVLSGGRLRLGVGLGWNHVEYEALGERFNNRGRRIKEQIELLRRLWIDELITFNGEFHHVSDAGLNPLPLQRPIPVWMGANADVALQRAARIADGWFANAPPGEKLDEQLALVRRTLEDAGRDPQTFGIEGRIAWRGDIDQIGRALEAFQAAGATHVSINTMGAGLKSPDAHIDVLARIAETYQQHQPR